MVDVRTIQSVRKVSEIDTKAGYGRQTHKVFRIPHLFLTLRR